MYTRFAPEIPSAGVETEAVSLDESVDVALYAFAGEVDVRSGRLLDAPER